MIEDLLDDIDLENAIINLLEYEKQINNKKLKNDKLTDDEYFFDTYFLKPSFLVRSALRSDKKS